MSAAGGMPALEGWILGIGQFFADRRHDARDETELHAPDDLEHVGPRKLMGFFQEFNWRQTFHGLGPFYLGIKHADFLPIVLVLFDELVMVGVVLVPVMGRLVFEDQMQANMNIAIIHR